MNGPMNATLRAMFWPPPMTVTLRERARMVAGALIGILATAWLCHAFELPPRLTWIVAPMGASAVLLFCVPTSPLAQPWAVVGGNTVSALVGVACVHLVPASPDLVAATAVAMAIAAMLALRCLHPPGGATALLMAVNGVTSAQAALVPVLVNSVVLTTAAWLFHALTRHPYPHRMPPASPSPATEEALDAVLARYNQILDVDREELRELIDTTQRLAHARRLADTRCEDVMTREVTTVEYGTPLQEAWTLLRQRKLKTLPVVDRGRHVVGVVTLTDFLEAASVDMLHGFDQRLKRLVSRAPGSHSDKPEVVGQIMTRKVRVTRPQRSLSDLVLLFESTGHRHIPVVSADGKLEGIVTQSDVMAALKVVDHLDGAGGPVRTSTASAG
jgi:CBS domain-containing membrane protein